MPCAVRLTVPNEHALLWAATTSTSVRRAMVSSQRVLCSSIISEVTVYARGALITRHVSVPDNLPDGPIELVVPSVSPLAEPASLRATVAGDRAILGVSSVMVVPEEGDVPGDVLARLQTAEREQARLIQQLGGLKTRRDALLRGVPDIAMTPRSRRFKVGDRIADALATTTMMDDIIAALNGTIRALHERIENHAHDLAAALVEAEQARSQDLAGAGHPVRDLIVRLAGGSGLGDVSVTYAVSAARWWPAYSVRLDGPEGDATLNLEAFVAHATMEDWTDIRCSLSTADITRDVTLPELPSWRLGRARPEKQRGYRPAPEGLDALFAGYDKAMAGTPTPIATSATMVDQAPVTTTALALDEPMEWERKEEVYDEALEDTFDLYDAPEPAPQMYGSSAPAPMSAPEPARELMAGSMAKVARASRAPIPAKKSKRRRAQSADMSTMLSGKSKVERMLYEEHMRGDAPHESGKSPGALTPGEDWQNFDGLVMAAAADSSRGTLTRRQAGATPHLTANAESTVGAISPPHDAPDPQSIRGEFDHIYRATGNVDVPSNAQIHRITLDTAQSTPRSQARTVPVEAEEVFREIHMRNPFSAPLLAGPLDVFMNGAMVTTSSMPSVDRGGEFVFGLGVEERLRVARNVQVEESSAGLLGRSTEIAHTVSIEIASALGAPITVDIIDRIPITDDDDVEIVKEEATPPFEKDDQAERGEPVHGGIRWSVEVPPGEKVEVRFSYVIELSSKLELIGGNRRD